MTSRNDNASSWQSALERWLLQTDTEALETVLAKIAGEKVATQADWIVRQAERLGREHKAQRAAILQARDALLLHLYGQCAPWGGAVAWCDASLKVEGAQHKAGIGGVLMRNEPVTVTAFALPVPALHSLEAEIDAVMTTVKLARQQGIDCLQIHTDCAALVELWQQARDDFRLEHLRALALPLAEFRLAAIPPAHNPVAHRLARLARERHARQPIPEAQAASPVREPKFCRCRVCHAHFEADTIAEAREACLDHAYAEHPEWEEVACYCPD